MGVEGWELRVEGLLTTCCELGWNVGCLAFAHLKSFGVRECASYRVNSIGEFDGLVPNIQLLETKHVFSFRVVNSQLSTLNPQLSTLNSQLSTLNSSADRLIIVRTVSRRPGCLSVVPLLVRRFLWLRQPHPATNLRSSRCSRPCLRRAEPIGYETPCRSLSS